MVHRAWGTDRLNGDLDKKGDKGGGSEMWMVYDNEEGLVGVFDNYEKALAEYNKCKEIQVDYVRGEGEFTTDERVILAKVERQFYGYKTNEKSVDYDENGDEFETGDYLWDWKEDIND